MLLNNAGWTVYQVRGKNGIFLHFTLNTHLTKTKKQPWEQKSLTFPTSKAGALARALNFTPFHLTPNFKQRQ